MKTFCILFDNGRTFTRVDGTWTNLDDAMGVAYAFNRAFKSDGYSAFITTHPCAQRAERL